MNGKFIAGCAVFFFCVCVGFYFYAQWDLGRFNESLPSLPIQQTSGAELSHVSTVDSEVETTDSVVDSAQLPDSQGFDAPQILEDENSEVPPEIATGSEETPPNTPPMAKETFYFGDYTKEELEQIRDWSQQLEAELQENYSELIDLARLTPKEIANKYSTEEDRKYLAELGRDFFAFYAEELGLLLTVLPEPLRERVINDVRSQLSQNWGSEIAEQVLEVTLKNLK